MNKEQILAYMKITNTDKLILFDDGSGHFEKAGKEHSETSFFGDWDDLEHKFALVQSEIDERKAEIAIDQKLEEDKQAEIDYDDSFIYDEPLDLYENYDEE